MKTILLAVAALLSGCVVSHHSTQPSTLGVARSAAELLAVLSVPGEVVVETINGADWEVDRSGLLNLENPKAKEAGLVDGPEPIQVYFHVIRHPTKGTFIVDTGVENALRDDPSKSAISGLLRSYMKLEKMKVHAPLGEWLAKEPQPLQGVFLTHLHFDHITGMADVPKGTAVYTGPGETADSAFLHMFVQGSTDRALEGKGVINEWGFTPDAAGRFSGVIDVFGDGLVWAIWAPGHTPGSTVYLVRTAKGPVLLTGDVAHTRWGWDNDVEPGTFTSDGPTSVESFKKMRALVAEHPEIDVRLGHQR
jgi:N-acyl homoserine lactone hydrolase